MVRSARQHDAEDALGRGDRLAAIVSPPPGPASRALADRLAQAEAPVVNTLYQGEPSIAWRAARGANVLDVDGNRYIDLTGGFGVAAVGHRHPHVVAAVQAQSAELLHGLGDVHPHPRRAELAEALCALAPVDDPRVYFAISGADAVEIALKSAILATGRRGIVAFDRGYHGCTLGALAATSRPAFRDPFAAHLHGHVRRLAYGCPAAALDEALAAGDVAGVIVEPIIGREGAVVPPAGWLTALAAACRRHGALLIADEILTGLGRTGRWFACEDEDLRPDLLCCGKALAGGMPLAAVVGRREVLAAWDTAGECLHTATFLAHPVACAAALAALEVLRADDLPGRAAALGARAAARLRAFAGHVRAEDERAGRPPRITDTRGRGLLLGAEAASAELAARWAREALGRGVIVLAGGRVLRMDPPLVITEAQLDAALDVLEAAFAAAAGHA